jgi:hypothetical protein
MRARLFEKDRFVNEDSDEFIRWFQKFKETIDKWGIFFEDTVEEWDEWSQESRLQGEDGGKAGAREGNKITEQPNNRTLIRHRNIIDTHQSRT